MGADWGVRGKVLLSDYGTVFIAGFVIIALVGGALVYTTHVDPETETNQEVVGVWKTTGEFHHQATVVEENPVFPVGQTLADRSLYYTQLSPELDGTFTYRFEAPEGELTTDAEVRLVISSRDDEEELWRVEEALANEQATLEPNEELTVSFTVNVTDVREQIETIRQELGTTPGETEVRVLGDVSSRGTVMGEEVTYEEDYHLPLSPGSEAYTVENPGPQTENHDRVETVTTVRDYGLLRQVAGPLLFLIGIAGAGGIAAAHGRGRLEVSDAERKQLVYANERAEFDEWISTGRIPAGARTEPVVKLESLEDLVDTAIDCDRRVLYDPRDDTYHVVDNVLRYEYRPSVSIDATSAGDIGDELDLGEDSSVDSDQDDLEQPSRVEGRHTVDTPADEANIDVRTTDVEAEGDPVATGNGSDGERMKAGLENDLSDQGASTTDAGLSNDGFEDGSDEGSDVEASGEPADEATADTAEPVDTIEGIGSTYSDELEGVGVETVADLLAADVDELAVETGIPAGRIERWREHATDGQSGQ